MISTKKLIYKIVGAIDDLKCPIGTVNMYAGGTAPTGWLMCNGQAVSRTTYADLFDAIGVTFGSGDGTTTFNVPDLRDRMAIGAGNLYNLGATGGSKDAIVVSHSHNTSASGETFVTSESETANNTTVTYSASGNRWVDGQPAGTTPYHHRSATSTTGSSGTDKNLPPYNAVNFIIYAG